MACGMIFYAVFPIVGKKLYMVSDDVEVDALVKKIVTKISAMIRRHYDKNGKNRAKKKNTF